MNFFFIQADEELHCFCSDGECPLKGTMDLYPCLGSPIIASMPHFYNADPSLIEAIESGMHPDKESHQIFIDMETVMNYLRRVERTIKIYHF